MSSEEKKTEAKKKSGCLGCLFKLFGLLVVLLVALVAALPLWVSPVVCGVGNAVVPALTGTEFRLGAFELNPYKGTLHVGDLRLGNPTDYSPTNAVTLGALDVKLEPATLLSDTLVINLISVKDVFGSYVSEKGTNNVDAILAHVKQVVGEPKAKPEEKDDKPAQKVIIDKLHTEGIVVQVGYLKFPVVLPDLENLGRAEQGIDWEHMGNTIWGSTKGSFSAVGDAMMSVGGAAVDGAKAVGGLAVDGAKAVGAGAKAVGGLAVDGAKAVGAGAKAVGGAAVDGAKAGAKAVGAGAKAVGGAAVDGAKAVGDGAKAVGNALGAGAGALKSGAAKALNLFD